MMGISQMDLVVIHKIFLVPQKTQSVEEECRVHSQMEPKIDDERFLLINENATLGLQ